MAERAAAAGIGARMILVRDTYRNLMDSTYQTWKEWFPPGSVLGYVSKSEPLDFQLNVAAPGATKGLYHEILFRHAQTEQNASDFLSTEYDFIGLEEIAPAYIPGKKLVSPGISEGVFDMAVSRLSRKVERADAVRPELCMTCNPPPLNHWSSKRIIDQSPEYLRKADMEHFYFGVEDNAMHLRADYYSNLEIMWEGKRSLKERFLHGRRLAVFIGIPRFNLDQLDNMRKNAELPSFRGFIKETVDNILHIKLEANPNGYVRMWKPPRVGGSYAIGADVAEGLEGAAYSAAYVLDRQDCSICAAWHGHIEPEKYGDELYLLGRLYNDAALAVEVNNHGLTTLMRLRARGYPKIFYSENLETRGRKTQRIGFQTTSHTKPMLIDGIGTYLDVGEGNPDPVIMDDELIDELQTYGVMEDGTTGPQDGCFADRCIGFALALYVARLAGLSRYFPSLNI